MLQIEAPILIQNHEEQKCTVPLGIIAQDRKISNAPKTKSTLRVEFSIKT